MREHVRYRFVTASPTSLSGMRFRGRLSFIVLFLATLAFSRPASAFITACPGTDSRIHPCAMHPHILMRAAQLGRLYQLMAAERTLASMNPAIGNRVAAQMAAATTLASNPDIAVQAANFQNINSIEQEIKDAGLAKQIPDPKDRYDDMQKLGEDIRAESAKLPSDAATMQGNKLFDGQGPSLAMSQSNGAWLGGKGSGSGDESGFNAAFDSAVPPQMFRDWSREMQAIAKEENDANGLSEARSLEIFGKGGHALDTKKPNDEQDLDRLDLIEKALDAIKHGQYARAKQMLEQLQLGQNRGDALGWYALAKADAGLHDPQGALEALRRASELDPAHFMQAYERALERLKSSPNDDLSFLNSNGNSKWLTIFLMILASVSMGLLLGVGVPRLYGYGVPGPGTPRGRRRTPSSGLLDAIVPETDDVIAGVYKVVRQIGAGGMGTVYEAFDTSLQRTVALKMMRSEIRDDARERARFIKEAQTVAALKHPNIVGIHAIVEENSQLYLVFEYVKGRTLAEVVSKRGTLDFPQALEALKSMADALEYAHANGVVHRDLKLSNVMVEHDGSVRVMDFGVARQVQDAMNRMSMTNTVCGTPAYMAPEIEQGIVGREADVYSLAVCFYELLTGEVPFAGSGSTMLLNKMNMRYRPLSSLVPDAPAGVDDVLTRALEAEPGKRLKSPKDFYVAVAARYAAGGARR